MIRLFYITLILFFTTGFAAAQSINTEFGKNRVQHHDDFDKWWMYETENFITYWYGKGRNIAQSVIQTAELDHDEIQGLMEHRINDKIEIVVYLDLSDLKQSNIGSEEVFETTAGRTKIIGNKIFVYFDGNHRRLQREIREGIASVYLNAMLSGSSLQEIVQNSFQLNVPDWYQLGLVSYMGRQWDHLIDDELRDIWLRTDEDYSDFDLLTRDYPKIAGHSLWYYIDITYGKSTISNLLYLTRINRNLENSFLFVFGTTFDGILHEWRDFYAKHYQLESGQFDAVREEEELDLANKDHEPISVIRFSPDGQSLAYVHNDIGKFWVRIRNLNTGEERTVFKSGYRNKLQEADYNYPLVAWHPDGGELTIVYEFRDVIRLQKIHLPTGDEAIQDLPTDFQRVYSISYIDDLNYLFAASTDGYSDLYQYDSKHRQYERLTEDFHDDLDASYIQWGDRKGVLFASNRSGTTVAKEKLDTILPLRPFDLFFYDFEQSPDALIRLTNSPTESERWPVQAGSNLIAFVSESSGVINRHVLSLDQPDRRYIHSNLDRNIIRHHAAPNGGQYAYTLYRDEAYRLYLTEPIWTLPAQAFQTAYRKGQVSASGSNQIFQPIESPEIDVDTVWDDGFLFQSEFPDPPHIEPMRESPAGPTIDLFSQAPADPTSESSDVIPFIPARAVAARTKFRVNNLTTRLDNSVLFEGLESFAGDDKELETTPVGILLKAQLKDLFEDYVVEGGVRIPTSFNGSEYFLIFDNNKKLIDKRFAIYRRAETNRINDLSFPSQKTKRISLLGLFRAKYPFDVYRSVRGTAILRSDRFFHLASDAASSAIPAVHEKRIHLRGEYVFDNTINIDMNVKHGTRYKFYIEAINRFDLQLTNGFEFDLSQGFTTVVGVDARHYIPVMKHAVLALRGAAATSIGSDKILYYLGGVENWVIPSFDNSIPIPAEGNFAYKTIAAHVRGFKHNIRNGGSYAIANSEFRVPIFKFLKKRRIRSSFFRNFQVIAFFDAGMAWHGLSPNGDQNPINSVVISNPPVITVKVDFFRDPLVMGYGVGLRSSLFGYFLRLDYGWGIESRQVQDPILYFSIGTDF